jgi:hypothetical protein
LSRTSPLARSAIVELNGVDAIGDAAGLAAGLAAGDEPCARTRRPVNDVEAIPIPAIAAPWITALRLGF